MYYRSAPILIQWKTYTGVLHAKSGATEPLRRKCALYRRQWYPFIQAKVHQHIDCPWHFCITSSSSSAEAVAHKCWGVWNWLIHCVAFDPLFSFVEISVMQSCIWQISSPSYVAYRRDTICNDVVTSTNMHVHHEQHNMNRDAAIMHSFWNNGCWKRGSICRNNGNI